MCWNKNGALYSLPLSFAIPPSPPSSASLKIECQAQKVAVEWDTSPESGADSWIIVLKREDRKIFRKEVNTLKVEPLLDEGLGNDYLLVVEVYAKSSICGLTSTNFASKDVRHEPPPLVVPSSHGSPSTAVAPSSSFLQLLESLTSETPSSSPKKTYSSQKPTPRPNQPLPSDYSVISTSASTSRRDTPSQFHLTSTRISSPRLEYVDHFGGFDSDSDDDPSTRPVHRANYGYDKMPVNVHEDLITDSLQDKVAARAAPLVNTGLPPLLRTSLTITFRI